MKTLPFTLSLLACSALAGCASSSSNLVLENQSSCPQTLSQGQNLTLRLPSNPSTGYRWELINAAPEILRSLGPEVFIADNEQMLVGASGHSVWRFIASSNGEAELKLSYKRPWETDAIEHFQCSLSVEAQ